MKIVIKGVGKRFNYEWIFRHVNQTFEAGQAYAITGPNGSGKSTFLQIIAANQSPSEGEVIYDGAAGPVGTDKVFDHLSLCAPYLDLIEEFSLEEMAIFHARFKPFIGQMPVDEIVSMLELEHARSKAIKYYSSGMKQRAKLGLTILSDMPIILLDEPTTNLDQKGVDWYLRLVEKHLQDRLVIVCSNLEREYAFCQNVMDMGQFKEFSKA